MKSISIDVSTVPASKTALKDALSPFVKAALQELNATPPLDPSVAPAGSPKPRATRKR